MRLRNLLLLLTLPVIALSVGCETTTKGQEDTGGIINWSVFFTGTDVATVDYNSVSVAVKVKSGGPKYFMGVALNQDITATDGTVIHGYNSCKTNEEKLAFLVNMYEYTYCNHLRDQGYVKVDAANKPLPELDENGDPVLRRAPDGTIILDTNGNPIVQSQIDWDTTRADILDFGNKTLTVGTGIDELFYNTKYITFCCLVNKDKVIGATVLKKAGSISKPIEFKTDDVKFSTDIESDTDHYRFTIKRISYKSCNVSFRLRLTPESEWFTPLEAGNKADLKFKYQPFFHVISKAEFASKYDSDLDKLAADYVTINDGEVRTIQKVYQELGADVSFADVWTFYFRGANWCLPQYLDYFDNIVLDFTGRDYKPGEEMIFFGFCGKYNGNPESTDIPTVPTTISLPIEKIDFKLGDK